MGSSIPCRVAGVGVNAGLLRPPRELAELIAGHVGDVVLGLDVDGVLAPIVAHADEARLLPGACDVLVTLGRRLAVAVVSGRSLANLEAQFGFPAEVEVVGSHGWEWRSGPPAVLNHSQCELLEVVGALADLAVAEAGDGAWRETKPTSVVVHIRQADPNRARSAVGRFRDRLGGLEVWVKEGHAVTEVMVVHTSKATAMQSFRTRHGARRMAFVGDDLTDEEVFRHCDGDDITVRVGAGVTAARFRLGEPGAVMSMLRHLVDATR